MKKDKKWAFLAVLLCLNVFAAVQNASGQTEYDRRALAFFKASLENLMHGRYEQTIIDCNQVLRFDPTSAVTFTIRARAFYELGDLDRAIADCTQAIRHDRNNIGALNIRAGAYIKKGDFDRAIRDWESVLRINPDMEDVKSNIERARQQRGY